jgi:DsbC/DsbD-like thiol-disulfide interchange protein
MPGRFLLAFLLAIPLQVLAASPGNQKVTAQLLADTSKVEPGKPFTLAVHLQIKPGWHIYWKNSGETGLPTVVKLKLPAGFVAGPWQYPTPELIDIGGVQSYGYSNDVLLTTSIAPPGALQGDVVPIEGAVQFLVCSDVCLPGSIPLVLKLGGDKMDTHGQGSPNLIQQWQPRFPQPYTTPIDWKTSRTDDGWTHLETTLNIEGANWFPNAPDGLLVRNVKVDGNTISLDMKKQGGADVKETSFDSVLSLKNDKTKGVVIDVPVSP